MFLIALALIGVGSAWIVRGLLNRKYQVQNHAVPEGATGGMNNAP
jgi:hypothetical protein